MFAKSSLRFSHLVLSNSNANAKVYLTKMIVLNLAGSGSAFEMNGAGPLLKYSVLKYFVVLQNTLFLDILWHFRCLRKYVGTEYFGIREESVFEIFFFFIF